jgi:hypothetical protein
VSPALRPYTERLLSVLRVFDGCRGDLAVETLPLGGGVPTSLIFRPPIPAVPFNLLDAILANDGVRFGPVTRSGSQFMDLGAAYAVWRLGNRDEPGRCYVVPPEDHATVGAALAGFPLDPALLIDAGPEVVALWPLDRPLAVDKDPTRAVALLTRLAVRLGADMDAANDLTVLLPLCGAVRNWNRTPPDRVDLVDVAPGRTYTLDDLDTALAAADTAGGDTLR